MKKSTKILSGLILVVIVLLLILISLLNVLDSQRPQNIEYPKSKLSSSLFDSQNTVYTANESLTNVHSLKKLPYTIDTPEGVAATVGEGTIYNWSDTYYIYITEFLKTDDFYSSIRGEFCKALLMNYNKELTNIENAVTDSGYINGFTAKYVVDRISVANEEKSVSAYHTGYILTFDMESDYAVFVSVASLKESTENYKNCKAILDAMVNTIQYDKNMQAQLEDELRKKQREQSQVIAQLEEEKDKSEQGGSEITIDYDEITTNIQNDYEKATLSFEWTSGEDIVISLYSPDKEDIYYPSTITKDRAVFRLEKIKSGIYTFEVIGEVEEYSVKLYVEDEAGEMNNINNENATNTPSSITTQNIQDDEKISSVGSTENETFSSDEGIVVDPNSQNLISTDTNED